MSLYVDHLINSRHEELVREAERERLSRSIRSGPRPRFLPRRSRAAR
jgi:hypothetical protein